MAGSLRFPTVLSVNEILLYRQIALSKLMKQVATGKMPTAEQLAQQMGGGGARPKIRRR